MIAITKISKKLYHVFFCLFLYLPLNSEGQIKTFDNLLKEISYSIIYGQERKADSLIQKVSVANIKESQKSAAKQAIYNLKCLYSIFFHLDYSLDSLDTSNLQSENILTSHIQQYIKSERYFVNAEWEQCSNLSFDFAIDDLELSEADRMPILYGISLSNLIISRDNLLQNIDSTISINFYDILHYIFKNSPDSLNNSILIKLYWASNILCSTSNEAKYIGEIIWKKIKSLSVADLAYFESILSTYRLDTHEYYQKRNNIQLYRDITNSLLENTKGYFVQNKWFLHLLEFGLFGDNEDEDAYIKIEQDNYSKLKKISPYFIAVRLINYGIYHGKLNRGMSSSFFNDYYNRLSTDSTFNRLNFRLLSYASFEDFSFNFNPENQLLISFIEKNKLINTKNAQKVNVIYTLGYINQLVLNHQFKKIDSLLKFNPIVKSLSGFIENNVVTNFMRLLNLNYESPTIENYNQVKESYRKLLKESSSDIISVTIADIIEFASFNDDVQFADSLLDIYETISYAKIRSFDLLKLRKIDLGNLIKNYYVERSYITLYNKTHYRKYLVQLLKFKLTKESLINSFAAMNSKEEKKMYELEATLFKTEIIKSYKHITNTYDFNKDFSYFEEIKTKNNLLIDSLLLYKSNIFAVDSSKVLNDLVGSIDDNTIVMIGLASREKPIDRYLAMYILLVQKDLNKLKLVQLENTLFDTPLGNYFSSTPYPYTRKDKLRYFFKTASNNVFIKQIEETCANKTNILITGSALIDQIPFNVLLASKNNSKRKIYQFSNLADISDEKILGSDSSILNANILKKKILCLGDAVFSNPISSFSRSMWNSLPGTFEEVNFINEILKNKWQVTLLTKQDASKSEFLNKILNTDYQIIHLATHSFYCDYDSSGNPFAKIPISILPQREVRSSILFANGGNFSNYESTDRLINFLENNLVLGEISYLPLNNAELVVLSSCESNIGLPQVYNDYFGNVTLSTAFKYAGAKYVIGTRWEVADENAKTFFRLFYEVLNKSGSIEFSFDSAVDRLKIESSDPYIWGAFILIK